MWVVTLRQFTVISKSQTHARNAQKIFLMNFHSARSSGLPDVPSTHSDHAAVIDIRQLQSEPHPHTKKFSASSSYTLARDVLMLKFVRLQLHFTVCVSLYALRNLIHVFFVLEFHEKKNTLLAVCRRCLSNFCSFEGKNSEELLFSNSCSLRARCMNICMEIWNRSCENVRRRLSLCASKLRWWLNPSLVCHVNRQTFHLQIKRF